MLTPQQLEDITFAKAVLGGYDMSSVDKFLEPLTNDYVTLYNENNHLKRKMRGLVKKLEEFRRATANADRAAADAQKTCDEMIRETEAKCQKMLTEASAAAAEKTRNIDSLIEAENARVEAAQRAAALKIAEIQEQMKIWIDALEQVKAGNYEPTPAAAPAAEEVHPIPSKPHLTGIPSVDRPWMQYYPPGADQMTIPQVTMNDYLKLMSRGDDLTVLHYYGTDITWKEFFRKVDGAARAMKAMGLGEGDQIPVMLRAVPEFIVVLLAAERIGASLLCRDNTIPENAEAIAKTSAKVMFAHDFITRAEVEAYTKAGIRKIITVDPWAGAVQSEMPEHIVKSLKALYTEPLVTGDVISGWDDFMAAGRIYIGQVDAPVDLDRPLFRA